jgi:hypothetical protein
MAMTNAEKQAAWRARRAKYVKDLELHCMKNQDKAVAELEAAKPEQIAKLEAQVKRLSEQLHNYIRYIPEATLAKVVADRAAAKRRRKGRLRNAKPDCRLCGGTGVAPSGLLNRMWHAHRQG